MSDGWRYVPEKIAPHSLCCDECKSNALVAERLADQLAEAVEVLGDAVRAHTRAIWAISGEVDYPVEELSATGKYLSERLIEFNKAVAESGGATKPGEES